VEALSEFSKSALHDSAVLSGLGYDTSTACHEDVQRSFILDRDNLGSKQKKNVTPLSRSLCSVGHINGELNESFNEHNIYGMID
jgi:hypothetical protein